MLVSAQWGRALTIAMVGVFFFLSAPEASSEETSPQFGVHLGHLFNGRTREEASDFSVRYRYHSSLNPRAQASEGEYETLSFEVSNPYEIWNKRRLDEALCELAKSKGHEKYVPLDLSPSQVHVNIYDDPNSAYHNAVAHQKIRTGPTDDSMGPREHFGIVKFSISFRIPLDDDNRPIADEVSVDIDLVVQTPSGFLFDFTKLKDLSCFTAPKLIWCADRYGPNIIRHEMNHIHQLDYYGPIFILLYLINPEWFEDYIGDPYMYAPCGDGCGTNPLLRISKDGVQFMPIWSAFFTALFSSESVSCPVD